MNKKEKGRDYTNERRKNKESGITIGDTVVCKNMESKSKLNSNFRPKLFKVISRDTNEICIEAEDGEICRRDVSAVKIYCQPNQLEQETKSDHSEETNATTASRPKRTIKIPTRYLDAISYNEELQINQLSLNLFHSPEDTNQEQQYEHQDISIEFFK